MHVAARQGSFCIWAQPKRDTVTSSLIGWVPAQNDPCESDPVKTGNILDMFNVNNANLAEHMKACVTLLRDTYPGIR